MWIWMLSCTSITPVPSPAPVAQPAPQAAVQPADDEASVDTLKGRLKAAGLCPDQDEISSVESIHLDDGRVVYEVTCFMAAYQAAVEYSLAQPIGRLRTTAGEPFELGGLPTLSPDGTLRWLSKARGLGDCGSTYRYRLVGDALRFEEERSRDCDDDPEKVPPDEPWPLVDRGHCTPDEIAWFSCSVKSGKALSLCGTWEQAQYRFGVAGDPELVYPTDPRDPVFGFENVSGPDDFGERVRFTRGDVTYTLRDTLGDKGWSRGVQVSQGGKVLADLPCVTNATTQLGRLRELRQASTGQDQRGTP